MANDNLLTPAQELDAISKALAARVKSLSSIKGFRTQKALNEERERRIAATYAWLRKVVEARDPQPDASGSNKKAVLSVQWMGNTGYLKNYFYSDVTDEEIRNIATAAIRAGTIDGIPSDPNVDFTNFVVTRQTIALPEGVNSLISLRPKTPF
jgi:hypothetical protein